jgi:hypothetical protein
MREVRKGQMKLHIYSIPRLLLYSVLGIVPAYILNFIIEGISIPDPCYYHGRSTTKLFDLFYKMESNEGYHPSPTLFNTLLTLAIGIAGGIFVCRKIQRWITY